MSERNFDEDSQGPSDDPNDPSGAEGAGASSGQNPTDPATLNDGERTERAEVEPFSPIVSEDLIARVFTHEHGLDFRYDHDEGRWYQWNGKRWLKDRKRKVIHLLRQIARRLSRGDKSVCKASVVRGAERFAQADPVHRVTHEIWDAQPHLLGTTAGIVDLSTGELRPFSRDDYITKFTSVGPQEGKPERFLRFLWEVTGGDQEVINFIQRWMGYCLTGYVREHILVFVLGPGGNGKSVFLNLLRDVLGDYAVTVMVETLSTSKYDRHPAEMAALCGARLVTASETEANRGFAESRIKSLTGGDPVTARFMCQNPFTFQPTFKLMIAGNHAPALAHPDPAMRRRLKFLPFDHTPPSPDKKLEEKLREEHGQILSWAIRGCVLWNLVGLLPPETVNTSTAEYFESQDVFGSWMMDCCYGDIADLTLKVPVSTLHQSCTEYLKQRNEPPLSSRSFGMEMKKRGFESRPHRFEGVICKVYVGISLKSIEQSNK